MRTTRRLASLLLLVASAALADGKANAPAEGDTPPRYAGRQINGTEIDIDSGSGKAYVISFWASWCGPCRQELPVLANIQRVAGAERMQVIAVNIEERDVYQGTSDLPHTASRRTQGAAGLGATTAAYLTYSSGGVTTHCSALSVSHFMNK